MKRILLLLLGVMVLLNLAAKAAPTVGVSIGTVDAQPYATSGLDLGWSNSIEYVAKISDNIYLGFRQASEYTEGKYVYRMSMNAVSTTDASITIPDSICVDGQKWAVEEFSTGTNWSEQIENMTVPITVSVCNGYQPIPDNLYMLGDSPRWRSGNYTGTIYVCNRSYFSSYVKNDQYSYSVIKPYGWSFEDVPLITVEVEKNGEFAETYLTQNNISVH